MNIVLVGSGGHAKVIIDVVQRENNHKIIGLIDNQVSVIKEMNGVPVIGNDTDLPFLSKEMKFNHGIICLGDNFLRQEARK